MSGTILFHYRVTEKLGAAGVGGRIPLSQSMLLSMQCKQ